MGKIKSIKIHTASISLAVNMEKDNKVWLPIQPKRPNSRRKGADDSPKDTIELERDLPRKRAKNSEDACLTLCKFPMAVENERSAAELLLFILLAQVADLLVTQLPGLPALYIPAQSPRTISPLLTALLASIQGPERWHGYNWELRRPWIIAPQLSLRETAPSRSITDYAGGKFQDYTGKKKFCFPYINAAMVLMPGLPSPVSLWITQSTSLSIPIVFHQLKKDISRPLLKIDPDLLDSFDVEKLQALFGSRKSTYQQMLRFQCWLRKKPKRLDALLQDRDDFRPTSRRGRFRQAKGDGKTEYICMALALLKQYLYFASAKAEWITVHDAAELLLYYQRLLLPESLPSISSQDVQQAQSSVGDYLAPDIFYKFLTMCFLPAHHAQIIIGGKGNPETSGLILTIEEESLFITPRETFFNEYHLWLKDHNIRSFDCSRVHGDAAVQKELMDVGIPMRSEKNNPSTWRYQFFSKDCTLKSKLIACVALPLCQLPDFVQASFSEHFGEISGQLSLQRPSETSRSRSEGGKPL